MEQPKSKVFTGVNTNFSPLRQNKRNESDNNDDDDTVISPDISDDSSQEEEEVLRIKRPINKKQAVLNNRRDTIFNPGATNNKNEFKNKLREKASSSLSKSPPSTIQQQNFSDHRNSSQLDQRSML